MTKADIINRISEEQGIDRKTVALVIEGFMKCVKDALGRGRSVFLRGFGTFSLKKRAAKKAQNPTAYNHMHPDSQGSPF